MCRLAAALLIIRFTTVLPEELLFREVLHGNVERSGVRTAFIGGSVWFGLWQVATFLAGGGFHLAGIPNGFCSGTGVAALGTHCRWGLHRRYRIPVSVPLLDVHLCEHAFTIDETPVILRNHRGQQFIHRGQGVGGVRSDDDILPVP